jgi:hypothetical protein
VGKNTTCQIYEVYPKELTLDIKKFIDLVTASLVALLLNLHQKCLLVQVTIPNFYREYGVDGTKQTRHRQKAKHFCISDRPEISGPAPASSLRSI